MKRNCFIVALTFIAALSIVSCSDDDATQHGNIDPVVEAVDYDALSNSTIEEFVNFAKNPRLGFHLDKAKAYLTNWAQKHGYQPHTDEFGNVWFDVPATKGFEDYPLVILQGHMDMICASKSGETYDYTEVVGEPYYEGEGENKVLKGRTVNLGADNGIGVASCLAIAASDAHHGPLRILVTANEDYDMSGARGISPDVFNATALINIDSEQAGTITYGCAGGHARHLTKKCDAAPLAAPADYKKVSISLSGLKGGHSGVNIGDHRMSGSVVTDSVMRRVVKPFEARLIKIDCGTYNNAIPLGTMIEFAINSKDAAAVEANLNTLKDEFNKEFPEETPKWTIDVNGTVAAGDLCCSTTCTDEFITIFKSFPQGVLEMNESGRITKSNNSGIVKLEAGNMRFQSYQRSDYDSWLAGEVQRFETLAQLYGMEIEVGTEFPAWNGDGKDALTKMMKEFYDKEGYNTNLVCELGGLEPAYFVVKNPNLLCISVGPTIHDAHTIDEALYVSTIKPVLKVVMQTLMNANLLKH